MQAIATIAAAQPVVDLERFAVRGRIERLAILRELVDRKSVLTAYFGDQSHFLMTSILEVNPDREELTFDGQCESTPLSSLISAGDVTVNAMLDAIRILFPSGSAEARQWQGRNAFRVQLPQVLYRLQRRESYRVETPIAYPLLCSLPIPAQAPKEVSLRVGDISLGGVCLIGQPPETLLKTGVRIPDCTLNLPDIGMVKGRLEIVRVASFDAAGVTRRKLGCRFLGLPGSATTLIQRYVNKLQLERREKGA